MRAFGRDLIRGGHYGQRSCEPHLKAEHMAAPTNSAYVKKDLSNSEPYTHGSTDQCCLREESSCQLGAVHTWHKPTTSALQRFRLLSGLGDDLIVGGSGEDLVVGDGHY